MISVVSDRRQCLLAKIKFKYGIKARREGKRVLLSAGFSAIGQSQNDSKSLKMSQQQKVSLLKGKGDQEYNKLFANNLN